MLEPVGIECWRLGLGRDDARSDVQENPLEHSSEAWVGAASRNAGLGWAAASDV